MAGPQAEALAALREVVDRLGKSSPLPAVELIVIQSLVTYAIGQVERIAVLTRPRRARKTPLG